MNFTSYVIVVGCMSAIAIASGIIGFQYAKHQKKKELHGKAATFRELYEDNAPDKYPLE